MQCPMDETASKAALVIQFHNIVNDATSNSSSSHREENSTKRLCFGNEATVQFPLGGNPSVLLHVLSSCDLDPIDLAALEATCKFFRNPANFPPDLELSLTELAAFDMCQERAMFKPMKQEEKEWLKQRCGGSWKLVLRYILVGEKNYRREKAQVIAGPGHSIVVTTKGDVYSFGANCSGQLGLGDTEDKIKPCLIRSLQGIRITQAAVGSKRTMLVSDMGSVYTFGQDIFGGLGFHGTANVNYITSPKLVESLKGVFVVQASIGGYFSAVLSREGQVYTFSWGSVERIGHSSDLTDVEPRLLSGPLEDVLIAQIAAGNCYLLMLAYKPSGMAVYSIGCGLGGKLGHGSDKKNAVTPQMICYFQALDTKPVSVSAGAWHAAVLGCDGRVFTWGWGNNGCLGHSNEEECICVPTPVESLSNVKAVHVSAGEYTTFVVGDNGDVYSFGSGESYNLGFKEFNPENESVPTPKLVTSLAALNERFVQISATNVWYLINGVWGLSHTIALAESGRLYAFGGGINGQLGVKLDEGQQTMQTPVRVAIDFR